MVSKQRKTATPSKEARQRWLSILAKSNSSDVTILWDQLSARPEWTVIKPAKIGMVMVRGRMGGTGSQFNLGEMTITQSVICLPNGLTGLGYIRGRSKKHAELTAVLDAMLQSKEYSTEVEEKIISPLQKIQSDAREKESRKAQATKVEFFTLARGDR